MFEVIRHGGNDNHQWKSVIETEDYEKAKQKYDETYAKMKQGSIRLINHTIGKVLRGEHVYRKKRGPVCRKRTAVSNSTYKPADGQETTIIAVVATCGKALKMSGDFTQCNLKGSVSRNTITFCFNGAGGLFNGLSIKLDELENFISKVKEDNTDGEVVKES
jgi:hypothetical protein